MFHGQTRVLVNGTLDWVPGPSGLGWWPLAIALFIVGLLAGIWRRGLRVLALLIGVLVVVDAAHAIAFEMGRPGSALARVGQFFGGNFVSVAVWLAAIVVIIGLVRKRPEALYGAVLVALMVALVGGATDLSALWKSQLPTVGPAWIARVEVVLALALGLGVAVGAVVHALRIERGTARAKAEPWLLALVDGLDDDAVAQIAAKLDPDDVSRIALHDLATRAGPISEQLQSGAIVFVVDGEPWSLTGTDVERGRVEPVAAEIEITFPRLLQVLAGTRPLEADSVRGDVALVGALKPYLSETAALSASRDPAPAA
jgi:hypothetical protein